MESKPLVYSHEVKGQHTFLQAQDPHGVQGVDEGQAQAEPLTVGLGERPQLIMAPSKGSVALPRVQEGLLHRLLQPNCWTGLIHMTNEQVHPHDQ